MKITLILLWSFFCVNIAFGQPKISHKEISEIKNVFEKQERAWNSGNIEKFMEGYWNSEKLVFIGSGGPTFGWQQILDNYKKGYPDKKAMGELKFSILDISKIDKNTIFLIGKFDMARTKGDLSGCFSLVWQKIHGKWLIVSDHSSAEN
jgi:uncharacterized protein (TIGR02246 family)